MFYIFCQLLKSFTTFQKKFQDPNLQKGLERCIVTVEILVASYGFCVM
jgi:hypothetical protein